MVKDERLEKYPKTDKYQVIDTISMQHPYCVGNRHVAIAANHHCGILDAEAVRDAEKRGARCCMRGCNLTYDQHETALVVEVAFNGQLKDAPGLHEYLLQIKPLAEADKFAGFVFKQKKQ